MFFNEIFGQELIYHSWSFNIDLDFRDLLISDSREFLEMIICFRISSIVHFEQYVPLITTTTTMPDIYLHNYFCIFSVCDEHVFLETDLYRFLLNISFRIFGTTICINVHIKQCAECGYISNIYQNVLWNQSKT